MTARYGESSSPSPVESHICETFSLSRYANGVRENNGSLPPARTPLA